MEKLSFSLLSAGDVYKRQALEAPYMNNWLNQLARKYGRFGIPNLTNICLLYTSPVH